MRSFGIGKTMTPPRPVLVVRRFLGFLLALAAVAFFVWFVSHGQKHPRDDSCVGEKALNLPSHSRLDSFCNQPAEMRDDVFEGQLPDCMDIRHYELVQVIAVFRHGDRAPLIQLADLGGPQDFECGLSGKEWELLDQVTIRALKGKKAKVTFPLHPGKNGQRCRAAALTSKGFEQHRIMGDLFRQRYVDTGLLRGIKETASHQDMFVRVTGAPRCMQSAAAFLTGLHRVADAEVLTHQDVWFRTFPEELTKRKDVFDHESNSCKEAAARQRRAIQQSTKYVEAREKRFEPMMAVLGKWLGQERSVLPDITYICDILQDEHCRGKSEFCHTPGGTDGLPIAGTDSTAVVHNCLSTQQVTTAVETCDEAFSLNYSLPYAGIVIQPLLQQILFHMEDILGDNDVDPSQTLPRRFFLYFGHDSTLIPILTSLGVFDSLWPPLASRVTFELWRCVSSQCGDHKVRLLYNGRPLQGDLTNTLGFCNFAELRRLVERHQQEFIKECGR